MILPVISENEEHGKIVRGRRKLDFSFSVNHGKLWFWGRHSKSWQKIRRFLEEVKLEFGLPVVGLGIGNFLEALGFSFFSGFPKRMPRVNSY